MAGLLFRAIALSYLATDVDLSLTATVFLVQARRWLLSASGVAFLKERDFSFPSFALSLRLRTKWDNAMVESKGIAQERGFLAPPKKIRR